MSFFFLPLEEDAIEIEGVFCCLAIVAIALENVGELNEIPGTSENGKRRTVPEEVGRAWKKIQIKRNKR